MRRVSAMQPRTALCALAFVCTPPGCDAAAVLGQTLHYTYAPAAPRTRVGQLLGMPTQLMASPPKAHHALAADEWRNVFDALDKDEDGALAFDEVAHFMARIAAPDQDDTVELVEQQKDFGLLSSYDTDGDGRLDYEECELMSKTLLGIPIDSVLMQRDRYSSENLWLSGLRSFGRSSVLRAILQPLLSISAFSFLVALTHYLCMGSAALMTLQHPFGLGKSLARGGIKMHSLLGGALSLLLVFRTNTAYGRFWEARKIWEKVGNRCRELARFSFLYQDVLGQTGVEHVARLLIAVPAQLRRHLIGVAPSETDFSTPSWQPPFAAGVTIDRASTLYYDDSHGRTPFAPSASASQWREAQAAAAGERPLGPLPPCVLRKLRSSRNRPLFLCRQLGMQMRDLPESACFTSRERQKALDIVDKLGSYVGSCERLVQTPVPLNYARHTSRFLTLWCLTLPISLVETMGLLVVPVTAFVTWCLFGIQEIGLFIEHCALDDGEIFMDTISELVALDVVEALEEEEEEEEAMDLAELYPELQVSQL